MCKVLNARKVGKRSSATQVYIGRPNKWGNPFVIGRDGSRAEVIAKYRAWIVTQPPADGPARRVAWSRRRMLVRATRVPWRRTGRVGQQMLITHLLGPMLPDARACSAA